jgi:hypothetical protein
MPFAPIARRTTVAPKKPISRAPTTGRLAACFFFDPLDPLPTGSSCRLLGLCGVRGGGGGRGVRQLGHSRAVAIPAAAAPRALVDRVRRPRGFRRRPARGRRRCDRATVRATVAGDRGHRRSGLAQARAQVRVSPPVPRCRGK